MYKASLEATKLSPPQPTLWIMDFNNNSSVRTLLKLLLLLSPFFSVKAHTNPQVGNNSSFSYVVGAPNGPQNWGLNPNWTQCGIGGSQSPIDIHTSRAVVRPSLGDFNRKYQPAPAVLKNLGYEIEVEWTGDAGGIVINGTTFDLVQSHWHIPAEHKFNGHRYNMELHVVHKSAQGNMAVVAIVYKKGSADYFLSQIIPYLPATEEGVDLGNVNPWHIGFPGREYYRYNGSLTTPPCSENVTWTIFKGVKTVSHQQITALRNAVDDGNTGNARPTQPLNGRTVYLFRP